MEQHVCQVTGGNYVSVKGDGACLFRSISFSLYNTEALHLQVRKQCVDLMISRWDNDFKDILFNEDGGFVYPSVTAFRDHMGNPKTYGSINELQAFCKHFGYGYMWVSITENDPQRGSFADLVHFDVQQFHKEVICLRVTNQGTLACHIEPFISVPVQFNYVFNKVSESGAEDVKETPKKKRRFSSEKRISVSDCDLTPSNRRKGTPNKTRVRGDKALTPSPVPSGSRRTPGKSTFLTPKASPSTPSRPSNSSLYESPSVGSSSLTAGSSFKVKKQLCFDSDSDSQAEDEMLLGE